MAADQAPLRRRERADSIRNRAAIIEAAEVEFDHRGKAADVREIAQRAGVAMGTLYRHFATKEDLLDTILHEQSLAWETEARAATAAESDPWAALEAFVADTVHRHAVHVALRERLAQPFTERQFDECAGRVSAVADTVVTRCHDAGLLREGVTGEDIVQLIISLAALTRLPDGAQNECVQDGAAVRMIEPAPVPWRRQLRISMDGLRPVHGRLA
ncbi:TetR/AcrR family transcriptional regulator [Rhizobium lusitanum]|uniref:TetR/AcrR family transcriptional regulator n=1 Tax=Rhizobium lusitanum TaxID=293958 RepID=UPI001572133D|nr:TetR/AcrR family transcriptional regulator [Rhizobium lusitanum]NTJ11546.1 TetR/AcrR family transcriptional regulator [Rhizobium lusitanum]